MQEKRSLRGLVAQKHLSAEMGRASTIGPSIECCKSTFIHVNRSGQTGQEEIAARASTRLPHSSSG